MTKTSSLEIRNYHIIIILVVNVHVDPYHLEADHQPFSLTTNRRGDQIITTPPTSDLVKVFLFWTRDWLLCNDQNKRDFLGMSGLLLT